MGLPFEAYARGVLSFDLPVRPIRQAHGPSIFLGVLRSGVSLSNPEALEGEALDRCYGVNVTGNVLR